MAGGTASGKTTVCDLIIQRLHDQCVVVIDQDSFYRALTDEQKAVAAAGGAPLRLDPQPTILSCTAGATQPAIRAAVRTLVRIVATRSDCIQTRYPRNKSVSKQKRGLKGQVSSRAADYNFDSPDAVDEAALLECLDALKRGQPYEVPIYDFTTHSRSTTESRRIDSAQVRRGGCRFPVIQIVPAHSALARHGSRRGSCNLFLYALCWRTTSDAPHPPA